MRLNTTSRIKALQKFIRPPLYGMLITNLLNVRYLSNFTGSSGFITMTPKKNFFFTDFRYITQVKKEVKGFKINEFKNQNESIKEFCRKAKLRTLGFEAPYMPFSFYQSLKKALSPTKLVPIDGLVESLRIVKDKKEMKKIKKAISILEDGLKGIVGKIREGVSEKDIVFEFEYQLRRLGAQKLSFDLIVASGKRSALPHGIASNKKISKGDLVVVDFGCCYEGYHSDVTRTFSIGKPGKREEKIYKIVKKAQSIAIEMINPGVTCGEIDAAAKDYIKEQGFEKYFGHATGHGVGLDVHEDPRIIKRVNEKIREGMVFTIEPGIYIPKLGGVRIEDMVYVTESGCEVLTKNIPDVFEI
ncbi:MAG: hypothetical protein A2149_09750 [Candidatus Schekmanbacteria bacterium RBG_16_38_11]|uniref:Xaa-Pro dipeptidase n=1 Tax=Candidatus Schekmanbacteria bacterium RBG_16_38_11 TaxID=1817880 RepID=A0A1F7RZ64_9BACT|nr:MAG: hypothetical protein A2149_09750 [Candidatus Schekmanbacteria bacterium RBG_16_38_11]